MRRLVIKTLDLDSQDLGILGAMARNCRVSHAALGKGLRLSKDAVRYRIESLERRGFIQRYVLFLDARRLGFTRYHLLLRLDADLELREEIAQRLAKHPSVMWINTFIGRFDVQIIVDATDGFHLNDLREELFELCAGKVRDYLVLTHLYDLEFTQLNPLLDTQLSMGIEADAGPVHRLSSRNFPVPEDFERVTLKPVDYEILRALADDPRMSISDIADRVVSDRQTVRKRMDALVREKVILNFGAIPNLSQLGFVTYYLLIRMSQNMTPQKLSAPFRELQNIFYAGRMLGDYDMIMYLNARSPQELDASINLFRKRLGKDVVHYDLLVQERVHHWRQFSELLYRSGTSLRA